VAPSIRIPADAARCGANNAQAMAPPSKAKPASTAVEFPPRPCFQCATHTGLFSGSFSGASLVTPWPAVFSARAVEQQVGMIEPARSRAAARVE
jgi:hypothetical protein